MFTNLTDVPTPFDGGTLSIHRLYLHTYYNVYIQHIHTQRAHIQTRTNSIGECRDFRLEIEPNPKITKKKRTQDCRKCKRVRLIKASKCFQCFIALFNIDFTISFE